MRRSFVAAAIWALAAAAASAQSFVFSPGPEVLSGDPVEVVVEGLPPGATVTVTAERPVGGWAPPTLHRSEGVFVADAQGRVRLSDSPKSGTWTGADSAGAFWSVKDTKAAPPADWRPGEVRFAAAVDGKPIATGSLRLLRQAASVKIEPAPDFPGAVFAYPDGTAKLPVIVVLGGSEGGDSTARAMAPKLASRGYAVLGLPYYSPAWGDQPQQLPGLPRSFVDIPVDRLEAVRAWLRTRPEADVERFGVWGASKGAEFALIAAANYPWIDAVAAIVPTDVVWEGWGPDAKAGASSSFSFKGKGLPFVPYRGMEEHFAKLGRGETSSLRWPHEAGRAANLESAVKARIPVERYRGELLIAGGGRDTVWASGPMTQTLAELRTAAGRPVEAYVFPEADHFLTGDGYGAASPADAQAQAVLWPATLAFLGRALKTAK